MTSVQTRFLSRLGPVSADTGFPTYVQDSNGLRLQHCLDGSLLCGTKGALPDPAQPVSFPDNFPNQSFFFSATTAVTLPTGGDVLYVATIGAGFSGAVAPGNQHMRNRIRMQIAVPGAGHYTVTHPYGVDEFDVPAGDSPAIDFTSDIGAVTGEFDGVLDGRVDPFLTWDTGMITSPDGGQYIGDPNTPHAVVGSPLGTNFVRIDGPDIGGPGINTFRLSLFRLVGRLATNSSVDPGHPTYSRIDTSGGMVDVRAHSDPNSAIRAQLPGATTTSLRGGPHGDYVGRLSFTGSLPPAVVTVSNTSDVPHSVFHPVVTDLVTVTGATYDADQQILAVSAVSSDQAVPPTLTVTGFGDLSPGTQTLTPAIITPPATSTSSAASVANIPRPKMPPTLVGTVAVGTEWFTDVASPPKSVTVTSSAGGVGTAEVAVSGSAFPTDPVSADAGPDQDAQQGQTVTLDASATLNATSVAWVQTSGPTVVLAGADTAVATFVAPAEVTTLGFQLVAQGPGGPDTDDLVITVQQVAPPVANAGPDQNALVGTTVVLDGTASTGAATFAWTQVSGPAAALIGAGTARPTFVMTDGTLVFQLTVSGPGGSSSDQVSISSAPDMLTVTKAEFRPDSAEWRIEGTSSITVSNIVTVYLGNTTLGAIIGSAQVDPTGTWSVRARNSTVPPFGNTVTVRSSRGGLLVGVVFVLH